MKFLPLIGKRLKDDDIIEILEYFDAVVVYDFDRLHENMPDVYWAECTKQGIVFMFDADQILDTMFLYIVSKEGYESVEVEKIEDIELFDSSFAVESHCATSGIECKVGRPDETKSWARIDGPDKSIHYEFVGGRLSMVTISTQKN
jgi:hypothetical protein